MAVVIDVSKWVGVQGVQGMQCFVWPDQEDSTPQNMILDAEWVRE
jgi:hypothetical protein